MDRSYVTSNTKDIKALGLSSSWVLHLGREIEPSALDLEEVGELAKRIIGNWEPDVYEKHYDTKLPLTAMRAMPGHDSGRRVFKHMHGTFYGDTTKVHLLNLLFQRLDKQMEKVRNTEHYIAFGFLAILTYLR